MLIKRYDKVVSRLPIFVQQNINAQAPLNFMERLEVEIIKHKLWMSHSKNYQHQLASQDNAH
jgi:hypothetical protein